MSPTKSVQSDWAAYETAVRAFYAAPATATHTPAAGSKPPSHRLVILAAVIATSHQLGNTLSDALQTGSLNQRELAGWKLLAATAYDLNIVADLLRAEDEGGETALMYGPPSAVAAVPKPSERSWNNIEAEPSNLMQALQPG